MIHKYKCIHQRIFMWSWVAFLILFYLKTTWVLYKTAMIYTFRQILPALSLVLAADS